MPLKETSILKWTGLDKRVILNAVEFQRAVELLNERAHWKYTKKLFDMDSNKMAL